MKGKLEGKKKPKGEGYSIDEDMPHIRREVWGERWQTRRETRRFQFFGAEGEGRRRGKVFGVHRGGGVGETTQLEIMSK